MDPIDKFVLLAMADHADHNGDNVRPGNELLCAKTGLSERTISQKIAKLKALGILDPDDVLAGRGHIRQFSIDTDQVPRRKYFIEKEARKAERASTFLKPNQKLKVEAGSTFRPSKRSNDVPPLPDKKVEAGSTLKNRKVEADARKVEFDDNSHDKERARDMNPHEHVACGDNKKHVEPGADAPPGFSAAVEEIFEYWKTVMDHPSAKLIDKREKLIKARLKEGYTVAQIRAAILGCRASPFHQGGNASGAVHDDITLICRDGSKLESFIGIYGERNNGNGTNRRTASQPGARETHNARAARQTVELILESASFGASDENHGPDSGDAASERLALDYGDG